jgi:hypothetical protein
VVTCCNRNLPVACSAFYHRQIGKPHVNNRPRPRAGAKKTAKSPILPSDQFSVRGRIAAMQLCRLGVRALNRYAIASGPRSPAASITPRGEIVGSGGSALS